MPVLSYASRSALLILLVISLPAAVKGQRYYPPRGNYQPKNYRYQPNQYRPNQNPHNRYQPRYFQPGTQPRARTPFQPNDYGSHHAAGSHQYGRPRLPLPTAPAPKTNAAQPALRPAKPKPYQPLPRMIAEYEPQRAIMLSVSDLQSHHGQVLKQIVDESRGHAEILILYNDLQQLKSTVDLLRESSSKNSHVSFYQLELDTVWLRDFGPRISEDDSGFRALDFYYYGVRPFDDSFPERWALETDGKMTKIPWTLQGGNLITNGKGLAITTSKIFEDNRVSLPGRNSASESRQFLIKELKQFCNLKDLVVLDPLQNETTKHVDMFAAFIAANHVVIAALDPRVDQANSKILDSNARKMASVKINGKPVLVSRIKIPKRDGEAWSTYTNAIFTDRLVLVPTMSSDPKHLIRAAVDKYQKLLPEHHVATVDISSMKKLQGSLHCMTLNLPSIAPYPKGTISFAKAEQIAARVAKPKGSTQPVSLKPQYTIDKQLRRVFKSSTSDFLVDAYAVALVGEVITLLRNNDRKTIRVRTTAVCEADRYWIQRNADKIRKNGSNVQRYVLSQGSR